MTAARHSFGRAERGLFTEEGGCHAAYHHDHRTARAAPWITDGLLGSDWGGSLREVAGRDDRASRALACVLESGRGRETPSPTPCSGALATVVAGREERKRSGGGGAGSTRSGKSGEPPYHLLGDWFPVRVSRLALLLKGPNDTAKLAYRLCVLSPARSDKSEGRHDHTCRGGPHHEP